MRANIPGIGVLTVLIVVGMVVPAGAFAGSGTPGAVGQASDLGTTGSSDSAVNVTVGGQLATVLSASSDDVRFAFEDTAFEVSVESGDDDEKAEVIADRADDLEDRAEAIRDDYDAATAAYNNGELTASEYAQRLAELNARATNLLESVENLEERADTVSALELRAAGLNRTALRAAIADLDSVTGAGAAAVLTRFTGQSQGKIEIETADGLSIEVEGERGERSREIKRDRDANDTIAVAQADALASATSALSSQDGRWVLRKASVHPDDGYYKFEFSLRTANETGEAEVRVDGSTGDVFRLEEEIERRGDDEDDDADDGDDRDLAVVVADGVPGPGETVTIQVLNDGSPVPNATIMVNDAVVGTTDQNGTLSLTLPLEEAEIRARSGDAEGELEFEFGDDEDGAIVRQLNTTVSLDGDQLTVTVLFNGSGVEGATVTANDDYSGITDAAGTTTFTIDAAIEELDLEIEKGEFETEREYVIRDGSLIQLTDGDDDEEDADGDDREDDDEESDDSVDALDLAVIAGTPGPGETVTIEVTAGGEPAAAVPVWLNGERVGTTDDAGTIEVTFPDDEDDARIEADDGDADGRLEFDFEEDSSDDDEDDG